MKPRLRMQTCRALWIVVILAMLAGCTPPATDDRPPVSDVLLVLNCGTDVSLQFNLSGRVGLSKQTFIASRCHINMYDGRITISCPGNGLNWTEHMDRQFERVTTRPDTVSDPECALKAERNRSLIGR
jgi:hypothetical protein